VKLRRIVKTTKQTLTVPDHRDLDAGTITAIFRQACRYVPEPELRHTSTPSNLLDTARRLARVGGTAVLSDAFCGGEFLAARGALLLAGASAGAFRGIHTLGHCAHVVAVDVFLKGLLGREFAPAFGAAHGLLHGDHFLSSSG
jgi:hypothetical protein